MTEARSRCVRDLPQWKIKHGVRCNYTDDTAGDLRSDVSGRNNRRQLVAQRHRGGDSGIEVRAGERAESKNEDGEDSAGRKRIAEKRERIVTTRKPCGHDSGADNAREQKCRPQALGNVASHHERPMSFSLFCSVSLSSEHSGSDMKMLMR